MTHEHSWPTKIGPGAEHVGVSTLSPHWNTICEVLLAHGIPHTILSRTLPKPPTLEGWSFSVYNGAEEHASGWGSTTLADMAPALLAAVGMSDGATANKRAQAAENLAQSLAGDRDGAVEALDIAHDTIGKLCVVMAGAGFTGDLLTGIESLIKQRDVAKRELAESQTQLRDISHVLGPRRGDEPVTAQAERARNILARWQDLAVRHLPSCPQLSNTLAMPDWGSRHFELRGYMEGEIGAMKHRAGTPTGVIEAERDVFRVERDAARAACDTAAMRLATRDAENFTLRERLAECAEREDSVIAALGRPCSTNTIATEVGHLASEVRRYRHSADSLAAENAHLRSSLAAADSVVRLVTAALETPEGVLVTERAATVLKEAKSAAMWESEARKAWAYGDQLDRVLPKGGPNDGLLERTVTLAGEVTRLREQCERLENRRNTDAENEAAWIVWAHQWACQLLASPSAENLRWTIGKRIEDMRTDLRVSRGVLENVARVTEYPSGTSLVDHVAKVYKNSERANRMTEEVARLNRAMENTGGYGAREAAKALRKENESLRKALDAWQTWGHNRAGVTATLSDNKLRAAIDTYDAAYCAPALTTDSKEALDYLIAHPGHGLTAELALAGAKRLRGHVEHGLPALNPLRSLIELALLSGVNEAHNAWDAEVAKYRDEAAKAYKRLDQWLIWGLRAACVINADDDSLRMLIDRALPMWRRGTPEV